MRLSLAYVMPFYFSASGVGGLEQTACDGSRLVCHLCCASGENSEDMVMSPWTIECARLNSLV